MNPIKIAALANALAIVTGRPLHTPYEWGLSIYQFEKFMSHLATFGKTYSDMDEFATRAKRFGENDARIMEWNSNPERTHSLGHNKFSDWYPEEYQALLTYKSVRSNKKQAGSLAAGQLKDVQPRVLAEAIPNKSVNWIDKGAVNPVKD